MEMLPLSASFLAELHQIQPDSPLATELSESTIQSFGNAQHPQTAHRVRIIEAWGGKGVFEGRRVLELGCGQGDASVVLAAAVSDQAGKGKVVAWDPARGDYGSPLTVAQAQRNLLDKPELKARLSFALTTPLDSVLCPNVDQHDIAVLLHCIYYLPSPTILFDTLVSLRTHQPPIKTLCLAEYALRASLVEQSAHVLAVMAQSALSSLQGEEAEVNVRTVLSPEQIKAIARKAGWAVQSEQTITPGLELQDGRWEVGTVTSKSWPEEVSRVVDGTSELPLDVRERQKAWIMAGREATIQAKETALRGHGNKDTGFGFVRTMDVWCGVFGTAV